MNWMWRGFKTSRGIVLEPDEPDEPDEPEVTRHPNDEMTYIVHNATSPPTVSSGSRSGRQLWVSNCKYADIRGRLQATKKKKAMACPLRRAQLNFSKL